MAPAPVWETTEAPLSALLGDPGAEVLVAFGEESARCSLRQGDGEVSLDCGLLVYPAKNLDALLREVNDGAAHRALAAGRLADPRRFEEATRIVMKTPWQPAPGALVGPVRLVEPFDELIVAVGAHGEVSAQLATLDGEALAFRAGGLWALGNQLRAAADQIEEARTLRRLQGALALLLGPLRPPPASPGYGAATLGVPAVSLPDDERLKRRMIDGLLSQVDLVSASGQLMYIGRTFTFDSPAPRVNDCARVTPLLARLVSGMALDSSSLSGCTWVLAQQGVEVRVSLSNSSLRLGYSLSLGRRIELGRETVRPADRPAAVPPP